MPNEQSWGGVDDEVSAASRRIGQEEGILLYGPPLPVREKRLAIALHASLEADVAAGLEPDEHRLQLRAASRA